MKTLTSTLRAAAVGAALAGCVAALPARAAESGTASGQGSKQSDIGVVTGLAVGALAGGPVGAMVGAAAGALLGDRYHRQAETAAALQADLGKSEAERGRLTQSVAQLDESLANSQARGAQLDQSLAQSRARGAQLDETLQQTDDLGLDIHFRTNDDSIAVATVSPLLKLGTLALALPEARVRVAGYADPRGSDAYNDRLSLRRAQAVAAVLTSAGVPAERILIEAHGSGEADCGDGDLDGYAFERRVTVRLVLPGTGQVARRE